MRLVVRLVGLVGDATCNCVVQTHHERRETRRSWCTTMVNAGHRDGAAPRYPTQPREVRAEEDKRGGFRDNELGEGSAGLFPRACKDLGVKCQDVVHSWLRHDIVHVRRRTSNCVEII